MYHGSGTSHRPATTEARFGSQASPPEICGGHSGSGISSSPSASASPVTIIPLIVIFILVLPLS
jgi:hypothetical protein